MSARTFIRLICFLAIVSACLADKGIVKWFNEAKGFGFISPNDGTADIIVHFSAIRGDGLKTLEEGQEVTYDIENSPRGKAATNVTPA